MKAGSNLEQILESGKFAVTAELGPPKGTNQAAVQKKAEVLRGACDAQTAAHLYGSAKR